ncbi:MAG: hypothetical protein KKE37_05635 [Verrucomicrobia bacterium]|nr:hypothetical protein [Verrucomicrobiota bacterium]MBU4291237.1 hypothetical protein [Verrucomicrobiota bacterium]MBU4428819.1 hypothetical protein [Verrucomicrobiota bacterium]MCG2680963.1 hypothetical protein [Kiritimatiellia bacterium]
MHIAVRCWWLMGWLIAAMALPDMAPASDGLTNSAVDKVPNEASVERVAESELRDPFWPVGYSPVTKTIPAAMTTASSSVPVADDLMKRALTMLRIGGIIKRGTKCYAMVNGAVVEAGDTIPIMVDGSMVLFNVRSVDMKRIRLEPARK